MSTSAAPVNYLATEGPHGNTFPRVKSRAEAEKYMLSSAQIEKYRRDGFVHNVPIMTPEQVSRLRDGLERIVTSKDRSSELVAANSEKGANILTYMQGAWMIDEAIHDLVFHPAITIPLAQLLGV
ncbi:MAG TPA: hypothetical protein VEJ63_06395, partial [Planctomycetota bacterium]|nr:hypothetical protein [Planctomycetota bacterium]